MAVHPAAAPSRPAHGRWRSFSAGLPAGAGSAVARRTPSGKVIVEADAAPEVRVETVGRDDPRIGRAFVPADRVSARAYNSFPRPRSHRAQGHSDVPAHGAFRAGERSGHGERSGAQDGAAAFGHLLVEVEPFAEAVLVLDHSGSAVYADNVEFAVREGGSLSVITVQGWADDAVHLSHHHAQLGKDARIKHTAVTLGGNVVRSRRRCATRGRAATPNCLASTSPMRASISSTGCSWIMPSRDCRSRVEYKGALQGEGAHAVWIGDVIIRPEATGTDTYEYNRNLVLTDGTRVDSVPNLEILTGEVTGAGHASASGRLEDHHLFYLMARGIPYEEARRLVIRGFFGQLIERIDVPSLRPRVAAAIEAELLHSADPEMDCRSGRRRIRRPRTRRVRWRPGARRRYSARMTYRRPRRRSTVRKGGGHDGLVHIRARVRRVGPARRRRDRRRSERHARRRRAR